jgi:exopolysaccharide biosynthesis polyprenyl glycosylphosphotransferase
MRQLTKSLAGLASHPILLLALTALSMLMLQRRVQFAWPLQAAFVAAALAIFALARAASWRVSHTSAFTDRVLILGTAPQGYALAAEITARATGPYVVSGMVAEGPGMARTRDGVTCLGTMDALEEIIDEVQPARIAMALRDVRWVPEDVLLQARVRGVVIEEATTFFERLTGKLAIDTLTPRSLFLSDGFRHSDFVPHSDFSQTVTTGLNLAGAVIGLVLFAPLWPLMALAIRLDSAGPVLFVQERIGRDGKPFGLIKFRTMRQDGPRVSEWARDNNERITRVGRFLRRFRLDELPQLVNVLRGDMNLVGPRPHPACNYARFLDRIPYYRLRAIVRPGLTGWAQVRYGYANNLEEELEKMKYDLYYIKHRSVWLDLRIIAETMAVLVDAHAHDSVERRAGRAAVAEDGWVDHWPGTASGVTLR